MWLNYNEKFDNLSLYVTNYNEKLIDNLVTVFGVLNYNRKGWQPVTVLWLNYNEKFNNLSLYLTKLHWLKFDNLSLYVTKLQRKVWQPVTVCD